MTTSSEHPASGTKTTWSNLTWHVFVLALFASVALFSRFVHASFYGFFEDDFFYYALVAKHLVRSHLSSFNGLQLTNGYHPLWLAAVTLCYAIFPGKGFFLAIEGVAFVAILFFYFGVLRCLACFDPAAKTARLAALVLSLHALLLFRFGMEVTLSLPLGIATLALILSPRFDWTPRQTFLYGLLASFTVLSRLDSIIFFAMLMAAQTLTAAVPWQERWRRIGIFCAGWSPFLAYLAINLRFFHTLLPISGTAKQLKPLWPPTSVPLQSLFLPPDRTKAAFVYPAILLIAIGASLFLRRLHALPQTAQRKAILAVLFLFPAVHIGVLCFLSDWPVWPWYFYSFVYASVAAMVVLLYPRPRSPALTRNPLANAVLAVAAICLGAYLTSYALFKRPPYKVLLFVSGFANQHPGIYAMGDGSGTPAFLSTQPFIQLEGLMMDAEYIKLLRRRTPLHTVLDRYHADFYVAFVAKRTGPCLTVHEPSQSGILSPKLVGRICAPPLAAASEGGAQVEIYHASDVLLP